MTTTQLENAARRRLNATDETFWSSTEIIEDCLYFAMMDLCTEVKCYETTASTSSVAGTQTYAYPSGAIEIKRIWYDNQPLELIPEREKDSLQLNATTQPEGRPTHYRVWGANYRLFPTPDEVKTISLDIVSEPGTVASGTTISSIIPVQFHPRLVNGMVYYMVMKEADDPRITVFENRWLNIDIPWCVAEWRRRKHAGKFPRVRVEETLQTTQTGIV